MIRHAIDRLARRPRELWKRYLLAVGLVIVLLLGTHVVQQRSVAGIEGDAAAINLAGRQRMLSQRILWLSESYIASEDAITRARLNAAVRLFEASHRRLLSVADLPDATRALLVGEGGPEVGEQVVELIALAREVIEGNAAALPRMRDLAINPLLTGLNAVVQSLETATEEKQRNIAWQQSVALYLAIAILLAEAALIFLPAQLAVNRALDAGAAREEELKKLASRLERQAYFDPLTGLFNRAGFLKATQAAWSEDTLPVMFVVDIDAFKEVNDRHGNPVGDIVLRRAGKTLKATAGSDCASARLGADEFVIFARLPSDKAGTLAAGRAAQFSRIFDKTLTLGSQRLSLSVSVGYAIGRSPGADVDDVLSNADLALQWAKQTTGKSVVAFDAAMRSETETRRQLTADVDAGIAAGHFFPVFQPQVHTESGACLGVEVLARWRHPTRGVLSPGEFLEAAERMGAVDALDAQVRASALEAVSRLRDNGVAIPRVSLNVSGATLRDRSFVDTLSSEVFDADLSPADIALEVLETVLIEDRNDTAVETVSQLRASGFAVEMDDFGTGHASLSALMSLQLSGLKIDRSFVTRLPDPRAWRIIEAVAGLSKSAGLDVVMEGVETSDHVAFARRLGIRAIQGFGIARPMDEVALAKWLRSGQSGQALSA